MNYLGYDRTSSSYRGDPSVRIQQLYDDAKSDDISLVDVLFHNERKRDDPRRFQQILEKMKEVGAQAIYATFEDRLAPYGFGQWPYRHPLIRNITVKYKHPKTTTLSQLQAEHRVMREAELILCKRFAGDEQGYKQFIKRTEWLRKRLNEGR